MKLVVGLGNPGPAYARTRHNLGFMVIEALAKHFGAKFKDGRKSGALKIKLRHEGNDFILCMPLSYMNLSGGPASKLMRENKLTPRDLLVICDDVNLGLGRIKIKAGGSAGGHNGLNSIISALASEDFARLRVGICAPRGQKDLSGYVLSRFSKAEEAAAVEAIERAKDAVLCWLENGTEITMNRFNRMKGVEQ